MIVDDSETDLGDEACQLGIVGCLFDSRPAVERLFGDDGEGLNVTVDKRDHYINLQNKKQARHHGGATKESPAEAGQGSEGHPIAVVDVLDVSTGLAEGGEPPHKVRLGVRDAVDGVAADVPGGHQAPDPASHALVADGVQQDAGGGVGGSAGEELGHL